MIDGSLLAESRELLVVCFEHGSVASETSLLERAQFEKKRNVFKSVKLGFGNNALRQTAQQKHECAGTDLVGTLIYASGRKTSRTDWQRQ